MPTTLLLAHPDLKAHWHLCIICLPLLEIGLTYLLKAPPSTPKDDTPEYNTMLFKNFVNNNQGDK